MLFCTEFVPYVTLDVFDADFSECHGLVMIKQNAKSVRVICPEDVSDARFMFQVSHCQSKITHLSANVNNLYHAFKLPNVKVIQLLSLCRDAEISQMCHFVTCWKTRRGMDDVEFIYTDAVDLRVKTALDKLKLTRVKVTPRISVVWAHPWCQEYKYIYELEVLLCFPVNSNLNLQKMVNLQSLGLNFNCEEKCHVKSTTTYLFEPLRKLKKLEYLYLAMHSGFFYCWDIGKYLPKSLKCITVFRPGGFKQLTVAPNVDLVKIWSYSVKLDVTLNQAKIEELNGGRARRFTRPSYLDKVMDCLLNWIQR